MQAPCPVVEVDEFFRHVAESGATNLAWKLIKPAFLWKMEAVCRAVVRLATLDKVLPSLASKLRRASSA